MSVSAADADSKLCLMTFTLQAVVVSTGGPAVPNKARLEAVAGQTVQPNLHRKGDIGWSDEAVERVAPQVTSNTEGKIKRVDLVIEFDEESAPMEVGQVVYFTGSFSARRPAPAG